MQLIAPPHCQVKAADHSINCEQAFRYYEQNLGGKLLMLMRQSEAPGASRSSEG